LIEYISEQISVIVFAFAVINVGVLSFIEYIDYEEEIKKYLSWGLIVFDLAGISAIIKIV
jgi:hypothetical protein